MLGYYESYQRPWWLFEVPHKYSSWIYFAIFMVTSVLSWVLRDYGGEAGCQGGTSSADGQQQQWPCGPLAVLRMSMGSVCFYSIMFLSTLGLRRDDEHSWRRILHDGLWPYKIVCLGVLIGTAFLYPSHVLTVYQQIARAFGVVFIIIQMIMFLDFVYLVNDYVLEKESRWWSVALVMATLVLIGGASVAIAFLCIYWIPSPTACTLNLVFVCTTLGLFVIYGLLSVSPIRPPSCGLFSSAVVYVYCTFYCWSALNSEPSTGVCTPESNPGGGALQILAFIFAVIMLVLGNCNMATSSSVFNLSNEVGRGSFSSDELLYRPDFFYLVYLTGSAYVSMILLGWDMAVQGQEGDMSFTLDQGYGSTWAKMSASWFCSVLYTWTLVAHRVLGRCRDFDHAW